jgi:acyl-CoA reductase-like NAD-dependent aldehyde dehydrogenase
VPASERAAELADWMRGACLDGGRMRELGRRIGLDEDWNGRVDLHALARDLDRDLARPRSACGPVAVVACHWSELAGGLLRAVGSALQAGRAVLILADARTPMCADAVIEDLLEAGLPAELVAVLHGLGTGARALLAGDERLGDALVSSADADGIRDWRAWGLELGLAAPELRLLRAGSYGVSWGDDLELAAQRVSHAAFDGERTLFGQAAGSVGQVQVDERCFSAFSEALLRELAAGGWGQRGLALIDRAARDDWEQRWTSGLDQGATLIAGGASFSQRPGARDLRVQPTVLTNVEPHMLCARAGFPSPVLCLLRADKNN